MTSRNVKPYMFPPLHKGQAEVWDCVRNGRKCRIGVLACGARWGKDRLSIEAMLANAIFWGTDRDEVRRRTEAMLIPKVLCWYVAPSFSLLRQAWEELQYFAGIVPGLVINRSDMRAFLPGGIEIEFKSADRPESLLGRGLDMIVCTEAARMKKDAWENRLLTRISSPGRGPKGKGGIALLNSTPEGRNWYYDLWLKGQDKSQDYVRSWRFTSYDNPFINKDELDRHRTLIPEKAFAQEYLAEFVAGGGSVFRRIAECFQEYEYPAIPDPGSIISIGIDWGRHNDRTAIIAVEYSFGECRVIDSCLITNTRYEQQIVKIKNFCARFRTNAIITAESNGLGDPLIEQLEQATNKKIIPFQTTAITKRNIIETAAMLIEQKAVVFPSINSHGVQVSACPELTEELTSYQAIEKPGGNIAYSAPVGKHDDLVMAFCFALSGRKNSRSSARLEVI